MKQKNLLFVCSGWLVALLLLPSLGAGQIVITEVNSTQNAYATYVEIYNAGSTPVDISAYTYSYWNNGTSRFSDRPLAGNYGDGLILSPGEYFLLLRSKSKFQEFYPGVLLNDGADDEDNSLIEYDAYGFLYLNGGNDFLVVKDGSGVVVDQFLDGSDSWPDNHCFERVGYPNSGTSLTEHWRDLGADVTGSPASKNDNSLPVFLTNFAAQVTDQGILLTWKTQSELNNLGFYVCRDEKRDGEFPRISPLIPGAGDATEPRTYRWLDERVRAGATYFYRLEAQTRDGRIEPSKTIEIRYPAEEMEKGAVRELELSEAYPNPFGDRLGRSRTSLWFTVAPSVASKPVSVRIFNLLGQEVYRFPLQKFRSGRHQLAWNGVNQRGEKAGNGIYFWRVEVGERVSFRKVVLVR